MMKVCGWLAEERTMGKANRKAAPSFKGRWNIVSMSTWDEDYFNEEVQAYIEFKPKDGGEFQFGYVQGEMDCRLTTRGEEPAVEWTWDGYDGGGDQMTGRGWAVLRGDELHGMIFIHQGDDSEFVARKAES
jgi:hypothetical protein